MALKRIVKLHNKKFSCLLVSKYLNTSTNEIDTDVQRKLLS